MEFAANIFVAVYHVSVKSSVFKPSVVVYDALGNIHHLSRIILKLVCKHNHGKSKSDLLHRYFHIDRKSSLRKKGYSSVSKSASTAVNRGNYRMVS